MLLSNSLRMAEYLSRAFGAGRQGQIRGDPWGVMYSYVRFRTIGIYLRSAEEKP